MKRTSRTQFQRSVFINGIQRSHFYNQNSAVECRELDFERRSLMIRSWDKEASNQNRVQRWHEQSIFLVWRSFFQTPFLEFMFCSFSFKFWRSTLHTRWLRFEPTLKIDCRWLEGNFWSRFLNSILEAPLSTFDLPTCAFWKLVIDIDLFDFDVESSVFHIQAISCLFLRSFPWMLNICNSRPDMSFSDSSSASLQKDVMFANMTFFVGGIFVLQNAREHLLHSNEASLSNSLMTCNPWKREFEMWVLNFEVLMFLFGNRFLKFGFGIRSIRAIS